VHLRVGRHELIDHLLASLVSHFLKPPAQDLVGCHSYSPSETKGRHPDPTPGTVSMVSSSESRTLTTALPNGSRTLAVRASWCQLTPGTMVVRSGPLLTLSGSYIYGRSERPSRTAVAGRSGDELDSTIRSISGAFHG
jgi:hypothetical protein